MNDKELADKIVQIGVGKKSEPHMYGDYMVVKNAFPYRMSTEAFVRDWRVAGALMEKCSMIFIENTPGTWACRADRCYGDRTRKWYHDDSQPRAINEACVEALT